MAIIIHYRYIENNVMIGEGRMETIDPVDPALIPTVGKEIALDPPADDWARVVAVTEETKDDPAGRGSERIFTLKIERL